jgi:uncharacterized protein (TIGR03437 family)
MLRYGLAAKTCLLLLPVSMALAQQSHMGVPINGRSTIILKGNLNPKADPRADRGPVEDGRRITAITLLLKQSPAQQADFAQLLQDQQTPGSPDYHNWLTPEQYADRFGLDPAAYANIVSWLKAEGFSVDYQARARNWMLFSGTAKQVSNAFHTSLHHFQVNGELHFAATVEPSIPAALEPVVAAIQGLDDFRMEPPARKIKPLATPDLNNPNGTHNLAPGDVGVIYDINKLYSQGINGSGQKLVVVGQTNIYLSDVQNFRSSFGLPANDPLLVLVPGSANPGYTADLDEANLDLDWTGAVARNATISYVYSQNVVTSLEYAIDQNIAPVISMSYGGCELKISSTPASTANAYRAVAQQANAEGITWLASSGDSGAAACDNSGNARASGGLSVNMPASIPEVTAVGGTTFNEGVSNYWSTNNGGVGTTALSYIPENAWNDTVERNGLSSSGGGVSVFFSKPSWQSAPGVPADGARDVPDVSFAASADHDGYIIVENGQVGIIGGTSAATPLFAGIVTLLNQYLVQNGALSKPGLGNINPTLYGLARNSSGVFHDITLGSNIVPCLSGTPNCSNGNLGYNTGPGYDLVTGLGSVDAYNLATSWNVQPGSATTTSLTANPQTLSISSTVTLTAIVKAISGSATPSGSVTFTSGKTTFGSANLSASGTASLVVYGSQLSAGSNTITASYGGGQGFNGSSASVVVTVSVPTSTSAIVPSVNPNPIYQQPPDSSGFSFFFTVSLTEIAGVATTLTDITIFGKSYASQIGNFFGTANIPAYGTISAALGASVNTFPDTEVLGFTGRDASGATWTQQVTVQFLPKQLSAAMTLTSSPATEVRNPTYDPNCTPDFPFYQELDLQEKNGYEVQLTKFLAGGNDLSSSIQDWFGSWRLAPLGSLQAGICWSTNSLPTTLNYELDGTDTQGNYISVTASVPFRGPSANSGVLSTSVDSIPLSTGAGQTVTSKFSVSLPSGQQWSLSVFPNNQTTKWLSIYPLSGTGPAEVFLTAAGAGLANGAYTATLVVQSVNTIPQFVNVPVTFTIGGSSLINIGGVANAASYEPGAAPGMLMYVGGSGLAASSQLQVASKVPLPFTIGGVSATVNGVPAPIYYTLPYALVIQVPYETPTGPALLAVNENGRVATFTFEVYPSLPGIFVDSNSQLVPTGTAKRGQSLPFFITGEGDVTGGLATGASPSTSIPVNQLPAPRGKFTMTVGGVPVTPLFVGIPYGLVGVTQVNFTVPANAPTGLQNVIVTVVANGQAYKSFSAKINITP